MGGVKGNETVSSLFLENYNISIAHINFRNKEERGWKAYGMEIKIKHNQV